MDAPTSGYRQSHMAKGACYHARFSQNPRRRLTWTIEQRILDTILDSLLARRKVNYLDFACGTGRILAHLEKRVASSTGVDRSSEMLKVAKTRVVNSRLCQADITRDSVFGSTQFDLISAFRFFPNAEPQLRQEAMQELVNRLRSDGLLVFNNHRSTNFSRNRLARFVTRGVKGNQGMSPQEVQELVERAGLEIVATYHTEIVPETETQLFHPRWLIEITERIGSRLPLAWLAQNVIYVCQHRSSDVEKQRTAWNPIQGNVDEELR